VTDPDDRRLQQGQSVWVVQADGSQRSAEYVGDAQLSAWWGGAPTVYVVYRDTGAGEAVEMERVIPSDT
jgi:hypothetical protein